MTDDPAGGVPHSPLRPATDTDADLVLGWWRWALGVPGDRNPFTDTDGRFSAQGQPPSGAWFLAGTMGGTVRRRIEMPAGRTVVVPVVNVCRRVGLLGPKTVRMKAAVTSVRLDGAPVPVVEVGTRAASFQVAAGQPFTNLASLRGDGSGTAKASTFGVYGIFTPEPGEHALDVYGEFSGGFWVALNITLVVR